jgi:hypothetical protein
MISDRAFFCHRDVHSTWRWDGSLVAWVKARSHLEALSGATRVAHALPHVARSRLSDAGDCHGIRKHRLLSPSHLGLVAGCRDFSCQRTGRCCADFYGPLSRGWYWRRSHRRYPFLPVATQRARSICLECNLLAYRTTLLRSYLICPRRRKSGVIVSPCANTEKATTAKVITTMRSRRVRSSGRDNDSASAKAPLSPPQKSTC